MTEDSVTAQPVGYIQVLRQNRQFRLLWYGQITSELGDWLDYLALHLLLWQITGSGAAVAGLLVAQFLPFALVSPFVGILIDRLPRKWVMIFADISRALVVLPLLLVDEPSEVWIIYVVMMTRFSLAAFYEPARNAILPAITSDKELVAANAVSGLTWSVILTSGAAIGGWISHSFSPYHAFILNALSFTVSAIFVSMIRVPNEVLETRQQSTWQDLKDAIVYLASHRDALFYASTKALWGLGGGGLLVLITLSGQQVFPLGNRGALSLALFYVARGLGTGLGPWLARRLGGDSIPFLRRSLGPSFFVMSFGYLIFVFAPTLPVAMLGIFIGHLGGGLQWVFSSALLQLTVPARLRGRIFTIELMLLTLTISLSSYLIGLGVDADHSLMKLGVIFSLPFIPFGVLLLRKLWSLPILPSTSTEQLS